MTDINQRPLWRKDAYWEKPNPHANRPAPAGIAQLAQQRGATPRPVRPPAPNTSEPLPSTRPSLFLPDSDVTFPANAQPNLLEQGIGAVRNLGQPSSVNEWDERADSTVGNSGNKAMLTRTATRNLEQRGIPLTAANINQEVQRLMKEFGPRKPLPSEATPVGQGNTPPQVNDGISSLPQAAPVDDSPAETMAFLDQEREPDESLEDFAKRIGVNLNDPAYNNWDYIRDMSAGLLASDSDNFLEAVGDASLLSNRNKLNADNREDSKRTGLATAKWAADDRRDNVDRKAEAVENAAMIKAAGKKGESKLGTVVHSFTDRDGTETSLRPILSGAEFYPSERIVIWNGKEHLKSTAMDVNVGMNRIYSNKKELDTQIDTYMASTAIDSQLKYVAENTPYQNEMLARWQRTDEFSDIIKTLRDSTVEGAQAYADALVGKDGQEAAALATALSLQGGVMATVKDDLYTGLFAQLNPGEVQELKDVVNKRAREMGRTKMDENPENPLRAIDMIKPAMSDVMKNMNWNEEGVLLFGTEYTPNELDNFRDSLNESTGQGWFNTQGFTEDNPLSQLNWEQPWNRPDESSVFNKSQWELLPDDQKNDVMDMGSTISSDLQKNHNVSEKQANKDIIASLIDSNSVGGGKDMIGWDNQQSVLRKPKQWYVEPPAFDGAGKRRSVDELRKAGVLWNGFKGEWFTFREEDGELRRKIIANSSEDPLKRIAID